MGWGGGRNTQGRGYNLNRVVKLDFTEKVIFELTRISQVQ